MNKVERIRPGAKAFIVWEGKILVVKERVRRDDQEVIIIDFPGGGIDLGETPRQAVVREVKEEVGLDIQVERPVGSWEFIVSNSEESVSILCLGFECKLVGDPIINTSHNPAQEDIFETQWMTKEELLSLPGKFFANQDLRQTLENVHC